MRTTALAAAAALALALTGCAGGPSPSPEPEPQPGTSAPEPQAPAGGPCDYATAEQQQQLFGTDLGRATQRDASTVTVQGVTWHPITCVWDVDDLEVEVAVADAAAFETGTLTCMEPLGIGKDVQPVGGVGDQAWWEEEDEDEGMLRACSETHVVDVDVDGDDIDARTAAIEFAQLVLATL